MAMTVTVTAGRGGTVVRFGGNADAGVLELVTDGLLAVITPGVVVLDLADFVLVHPESVAAAVRRIARMPGDDVRVVCPRFAGRRQLRRSLEQCSVRVCGSFKTAATASTASTPRLMPGGLPAAVVISRGEVRGGEPDTRSKGVRPIAQPPGITSPTNAEQPGLHDDGPQ